MDDEGAAGGVIYNSLDLQLSKKTPKLSCRLETILSHKVITKLIEWTMKIRKYLDNEVDNDDFEVDHVQGVFLLVLP